MEFAGGLFRKRQGGATRAGQGAPGPRLRGGAGNWMRIPGPRLPAGPLTLTGLPASRRAGARRLDSCAGARNPGRLRAFRRLSLA